MTVGQQVEWNCYRDWCNHSKIEGDPIFLLVQEGRGEKKVRKAHCLKCAQRMEGPRVLKNLDDITRLFNDYHLSNLIDLSDIGRVIKDEEAGGKPRIVGVEGVKVRGAVAAYQTGRVMDASFYSGLLLADVRFRVATFLMDLIEKMNPLASESRRSRVADPLKFLREKYRLASGALAKVEEARGQNRSPKADDSRDYRTNSRLSVKEARSVFLELAESFRHPDKAKTLPREVAVAIEAIKGFTPYQEEPEEELESEEVSAENTLVVMPDLQTFLHGWGAAWYKSPEPTSVLSEEVVEAFESAPVSPKRAAKAKKGGREKADGEARKTRREKPADWKDQLAEIAEGEGESA